jgi:trehalose-phosphatase
MRYLFNQFSKIQKYINLAKHILLALDYDGTITPIVSEPKQAILDRDFKNLLREISRKKKFTVAVISGRALGDIKRMVGLKNIFYAGNHGFEIEGPGLKFIHPIFRKSRFYLLEIKSKLKEKLGKIRGVIIEDKKITLSIHYRNVRKDTINDIKKIFRIVLLPYINEKKLKISYGKMVLEVRPNVLWNKAEAVKVIYSHTGYKKNNIITIYLGDDLTDEDVFKEMKNSDISIYVGANKKSNAKYYLKDTIEVRRFLEILETNG